jgi:Trypsin-like peptidase domain
MSEIPTAIASIRDAVCALLRIAPGEAADQFQMSIVGTTWCVSPDRAFLTANHVLNNGKPRDPAHRYHVLRAPGNGRVLQHWPVAGFRLEDPVRDLALFDAPVPTGGGFAVPAIPIALTPPPDGTRVLTYGCPAPAVTRGSVTNKGDFVGIQTVLFTHANTGIVAAQYEASPRNDVLFEFSVGWHHGESGGPVLRLEPEAAAFAVMQHYRNIEGPHGTMAGPRRGIALAAIHADLAAAGARFV